VEGDAPLRLFLALRLPDEALDDIATWSTRALAGCVRAQGCRLVAQDDLHVTLAFLGSRPAAELDAIVGVLRDACEGAGPIALTPVCWRATRSVGMLVLADEGRRAAALAGRVHDGLEALGVYRREARPWLPHVTVCRFRRTPPVEETPPPMRTCVPSDAAAYLSRLHQTGARYQVLETVRITSDDHTTLPRHATTRHHLT
jgi:2'-5' RNA ligase